MVEQLSTKSDQISGSIRSALFEPHPLKGLWHHLLGLPSAIALFRQLPSRSSLVPRPIFLDPREDHPTSYLVSAHGEFGLQVVAAFTSSEKCSPPKKVSEMIDHHCVDSGKPWFGAWVDSSPIFNEQHFIHVSQGKSLLFAASVLATYDSWADPHG